MQKLTFSCNILYREPFDPPDLDKTDSRELRKIQGYNKSWITDILDDDIALWLLIWRTKDPIIAAYVAGLVDALSVFNDIKEIAYVWDQDLPPQRYKKVWPQDCRTDTRVERDDEEAFSAHFGLGIAIRALAAAGIQPRSLSLAVELGASNMFLLFAPALAFYALSKQVESLTLRDAYFPVITYHQDEANCVLMPIENQAFPLLQSLTIEFSDFGVEGPTDLPDKSDVPELVQLILVNGETEYNYLQPLLEQYGKHLRHLELRNETPQCYDSLFDTIAELNLETLVIQQGSDDHWAEVLTPTDSPAPCLFWERDWDFMSLAKQVTLEPPGHFEFWRRFRSLHYMLDPWA
ncbi:hypothetical protein N0V95_003805 [Ascochyta clinopodiicola]|nr:hypothetical protein N0V95_003805 [Ascochyta clinopodiicola]